jgi:hypothetical protein
MNFINPTWIDVAIDVFLACLVFAGIVTFWASSAKNEADKMITTAINDDYDRTTNAFKYQTWDEQQEAIDDFRDRWTGLVSRSHLEQFVVSLEEMRILCF